MLGENKEEYLEAIYGLIEDGKEPSPSAIAGRLRVKPSSVTEMLKKLDAEGFILSRPYQPVELTGEGYKRSSNIKRKHRLLERFLYDILKINKKKVHDEACRMEHALSDEAAESLSKLMKYPATCPDDGRTIPSAGAVEKARSLSDLRRREKAVVAYLDGGEEFKCRVRSVGIREGKTVEVLTKEPFGGPYVIKVGGTTISIGRAMASKIKVMAK